MHLTTLPLGPCLEDEDPSSMTNELIGSPWLIPVTVEHTPPCLTEGLEMRGRQLDRGKSSETHTNPSISQSLMFAIGGLVNELSGVVTG